MDLRPVVFQFRKERTDDQMGTRVGQCFMNAVVKRQQKRVELKAKK